MSNYTLKDCEKFKIMIEIYRDIFVDSKNFAKKIGVGKATVFYWIQLEKKLHFKDTDDSNKDEEFDKIKPIKCSFNTKSKIKICQGFGLIDTVWSDVFYIEEDFEEALLQGEYKKIERKEPIDEGATLEGLERDKQVKIKQLSKEDIDLSLKTELENKSSYFIFELAKELKSKKKVEKALEVLALIEERNSSFKYTHGNQIQHLRAILLSHDNIKDYDGAIHILRSLYHGSHYHLKEPEILTLLASNYKRKALDTVTSKEEIDLGLVTSALCLYGDAYQLKSDKQKYYDAINIAYLYNIVDAIEMEYADKKEVEILFKELERVWKVDRNSWWEVSSKAEFLMLLGKVNIAVANINSFLEQNRVTSFDMSVLFRQLNLYIKFTDDENAKKFLREIEESWEAINRL